MAEENEQADEPNLEDVYTKFNVEAVAKTFNPEPVRETKSEVPATAPDPTVDLDGFSKWARAVHSADSEVRQTLHRVSEQLNTYQQERQRAQEEADIKQAVSKLKSKVDLDEDFLEIALGHEARKDPRLLSIWENRKTNPKAWDAALNALGNQYSKKFQVRADPQLAENTRAMKASRDQMATTRKEDPNEEWADDATFEPKWRRLVNNES